MLRVILILPLVALLAAPAVAQVEAEPVEQTLRLTREVDPEVKPVEPAGPAEAEPALQPAADGSLTWPLEGTQQVVCSRRVIAIDIPAAVAGRPVAEGLGKLFMAQLMITCDQGKTWDSYGLYKDIDRPLLVKVPDDGQYGFRLVGYDQKGRRAGWPEAGTAPTLSVAVDSLAPLAEFTLPRGVRYFRGGKTYDITYKVRDDNLDDRPVSFELTTDGGATWSAVLDEATPTGTFTWTVPDDIDSRQCALRMKASDRAGNETIKQTDHLFAIDSTPPTVRLLGPSITMSKRVLIRRELDDGKGSGIERVDLYVTTDKGQSWQKAGSFKGDEAIIYKAESGEVGLHLVAVDFAGNSSPEPTAKTVHRLVVGDDKPIVELTVDELASTMRAGQGVTIRWRGAGHDLAPKPVVVQYTTDGGINWMNLLKAAEISGSYQWTLPQVTSSHCAIRLALVDRQGRLTIERTPGEFTIDGSRPVTKITVAPDDDKDKPTVSEPRYASNPAAEPVPVTSETISTRAGVPPGGGGPHELTVDQMIDRGIRYSSQGKFILARQYLQKAVEKDPTRARAWYELGKVHANSIDRENYVGRAEANNAAVLHFEKALELDPKMVSARNDLGLVYLRDGKLDLALENFRAAFELDETSSVYPFNVGLVYFRKGRYNEATQFFERATRLDPENGHALWYLARTMEKLDQVADAKVYWKRSAMAFGPRSRFGRMALRHFEALQEKPRVD